MYLNGCLPPVRPLPVLISLNGREWKYISSIKGQTSEVQGVVFSMNGYHFNGSKVDRRFSYSKIDAALQHNRCRERMGITAGIYETATPSAPSGTAQSELFNGSWGLLKSSGSSYNAADAEANQEMVDILRRRKKVKRKERCWVLIFCTNPILTTLALYIHSSVTYLFLEQSGKMLRVLKTEIIGDFINGVVCRCKFRLGYFNRLVMNEMQGG